MSRPTGRYAPSPSGPLHLGSLLAAVASFVHARAQGGAWRLRIDDLDTPRVVPGAATAIGATLAAFGLRWDGPVLYQSRRHPAYDAALRELQAAGFAFDCGCTRREARAGPAGLEGPIYPGTCRNGIRPGRAPRSVRLKVDTAAIAFEDIVQGGYRQDLARDIGDFVIRRGDGITAYQLATVVDDAALAVTETVRGADLLSSTPRQMLLQRRLHLPAPRYAHVPVLVDAQGRKLGKSTGAAALDPSRVTAQLWYCLTCLGQQPSDALRDTSSARLLAWAVDNWQIENVPRVPTLTVDSNL
jgi:glutamyl-Q tRNA(Asp) synthetase